ncbi:Uncharacterised protein [Mycobacterium tuberculosis]|nr:Uncharacterised protein [Mycobacterium tuberculosis]
MVDTYTSALASGAKKLPVESTTFDNTPLVTLPSATAIVTIITLAHVRLAD